MRNSCRRWSKSIGDRGNRVRLYEARPGGPIMRSTWIRGKEDRKSLGHRDRELATRQAYELLQGVAANEQAIEEQSVTLGMLARLYLDSPQHPAKKERTRKEDAKKLNRVVNFLGVNRNVVSLSESDVLRYTMARRVGDKALEKIVGGNVVSDRTVELDLILLMSALNWGTRERNSTGRRLLRENPLHGIKLPKEKNPRRPVMRHDIYLKLLEVAGSVDPLLKLALIVAESTGRRISGWRNLVSGEARGSGRRLEGLSHDAYQLPAGGRGDDQTGGLAPDSEVDGSAAVIARGRSSRSNPPASDRR